MPSSAVIWAWSGSSSPGAAVLAASMSLQAADGMIS
jgi:hypothetical protein